MEKLYIELARKVVALKSCIDRGNEEWIERHESSIEKLEKLLPIGSGFNAGTTIDIEETSDSKLVLRSAYHHMNEHGYYDGWSDFLIIVKPSLRFGINIELRSIGAWPRKYSATKDYIIEKFDHCLSQ